MRQEMEYEFQKGEREEILFHEFLEGIYVVNGEADVRLMDREYSMMPRDIVFVEPGLPFAVKAREEAVLCHVRYSPEVLRSVSGGKKQYIFCNSCTDSRKSYDNIRRIFLEIILEYADGEKNNLCRERSLLYRLLGELKEEFAVQEGGGATEESLPEDDIRFHEMLRYISGHYRESIGLDQLSRQMYVSSSTLSRLFRKKMGMHFSDYVMQLRLRESRQDLLYTDRNITQIAMECGFSNLSVFNRAFRENYGMTPSEYRLQQREKATCLEKEQEQKKETLRKELQAEFGGSSKKKHGRSVEVEAEAGEYSPWRKICNQAVNVGALSSLLLANAQYHMTFLAENLGYRYARLWSVFSEDMGLTDGVHIGNYSFDKLDTVLDFLHQYAIIPYLDLGPTRPVTVIRSGMEVVYYREEKILFRSRKAWEEMLRAFLHHVVSRYGSEYVSSWIFEFGYDIDHRIPCYVDDSHPFDYFESYEFLYRLIRDMFPSAKVGGPCAIPSADGKAFLKNFLQKSKKKNCVPDFVSIILFPYRAVKSSGRVGRIRILDIDYEEKELKFVHEMLRQENMDCEVYVSEWNDTVSSRNFLNDSCYRGCDLINRLIHMLDGADMVNLWMASDWVNSYYDVSGVANGGNGLLTKGTICKPVYYAVQFLNSLGDRLLACEENCIVTGTPEGRYSMICTNNREPGGAYFLREEDFMAPRDVRNLFADMDSLPVKITLRGLSDGCYVIKKRYLSPEEGSLLCEWGRFDFDTNLNSQEVKYIRHGCFPRMSMRKASVTDGTLTISGELSPLEMELIQVYPVQG